MRTRAVIAGFVGVWLAAGSAFGQSGTDSNPQSPSTTNKSDTRSTDTGGATSPTDRAQQRAAEQSQQQGGDEQPQSGLHRTQSGEVGAPASGENRSGSPTGGSSGEDASRPGASSGGAQTPGLGTPGATGGGQQQGGAPTGGYGPSSPASTAPTATTGGQDLGTLGDTVPSPQYWIGDAALFVDTALRAATVVTQEQRLSTPAPRAVASQVQYLAGAIQRAVGNLRSLQASAAGKASALSAIDGALTPLQGALDEASQVAQSATQGPLAQRDQERLRSVVTRLQQAQRGLVPVARAYNAEALVGTMAR